MKHDCGNDNCKLISYDKDMREWDFMETEYGLIICEITNCPFCGEELCPDGSTISP